EPVPAHAEPAAIEVADSHTVAVRVCVLTADVRAREEALPGREEMDDHSRDDDPGERDFFVLTEEALLLGEGLPERTGHRFHAELAVAGRFRFPCDGLIVIPVLLGKDGALTCHDVPHRHDVYA